MVYSWFDSRESDGIGDESQAAWDSNSQLITLVCNTKHISYPLWKASLPPHSSIFGGRLLRVLQFLFWGGIWFAPAQCDDGTLVITILSSKCVCIFRSKNTFRIISFQKLSWKNDYNILYHLRHHSFDESTHIYL